MNKDAEVAPVVTAGDKEVVMAGDEEMKEKPLSKHVDKELWTVHNVQARLVGLASDMAINKRLMKFFTKVLLVDCDDLCIYPNPK